MIVTLYYKQTSTERYETDTNERVRAALTDGGFDILGNGGGSWLGQSPDDEYDAENDFTVEAKDESDVDRAVALVHGVLGPNRTVEVHR